MDNIIALLKLNISALIIEGLNPDILITPRSYSEQKGEIKTTKITR